MPTAVTQFRVEQRDITRCISFTVRISCRLYLRLERSRPSPGYFFVKFKEGNWKLGMIFFPFLMKELPGSLPPRLLAMVRQCAVDGLQRH